MGYGDLPTDLLTDHIFLRLPVKSLVRFCCVSKPWSSLIKDPSFIKRHLEYSMQNCINKSLVISDSCLYSLDFPRLSDLTTVNHPLKTRSRETRLLGSCNGLLCLSNGDRKGMKGTIFFNPGTRKHHELPDYSRVEYPGHLASWDLMVFGFGYDLVNDDYKLVRVVQFPGVDDFESEVKVYSLKTGRWGRVSDFPSDYSLSYAEACGVCVEGRLHWVVTCRPETVGTSMIMAFDLGSEEYNPVLFPKACDDEARDGEDRDDESWDGDRFHINLGVLDGSLCVVCNYVDVKFDVWIMKKYGVQDSWTMLFSIAQEGILGSYQYLRPLALSGDGMAVLIEQDGKYLMWLDLAGEVTLAGDVEVPGLPSLLCAEMMVESLVPVECLKKKRKQRIKIKEWSKKKGNQSKKRRNGR